MVFELFNYQNSTKFISKIVKLMYMVQVGRQKNIEKYFKKITL